MPQFKALQTTHAHTKYNLKNLAESELNFLKTTTIEYKQIYLDIIGVVVSKQPERRTSKDFVFLS